MIMSNGALPIQPPLLMIMESGRRRAEHGWRAGGAQSQDWVETASTASRPWAATPATSLAVSA